MSDKVAFQNVSGNCLITNYKPTNGREAKKEDIVISFEDGKRSVTNKSKADLDKKYGSIYEAIASLSGNKKVLEEQDLNYIDKLIEIFDITAIKKDLVPNEKTNIVAGAIRLIFGNGEQLRIDFETKSERNDRIVKKYQEKYGKYYDFRVDGENLVIKAKDNIDKRNYLKASELTNSMRNFVIGNEDAYRDEDGTFGGYSSAKNYYDYPHRQTDDSYDIPLQPGMEYTIAIKDLARIW